MAILYSQQESSMIRPMRKRWVRLAFGLLFCGVTACVPTPSPSPSPTVESHTPTPTATQMPSPTPTQEPKAVVEVLNLVPGDEPKQWRVIGWVQNLTENAAITEIQFIPLDPQGYPDLEKKRHNLEIVLAAADHAPFQINITSELEPPILQSKIVRFELLEEELQQLEIHILQQWPNTRGEDLLVEVYNPHPTALEIMSWTVTGKNIDEQPLIVFTPDIPAGVILPFQHQTIGVHVEHSLDISAWEHLIFAQPLHGLTVPKLTIVQEPVIHQDAQGNPFLVGVLRNEGTKPSAFYGSFLLEMDGRPAALVSLFPQIPLPVGRDWPIVVTDFPFTSPDWNDLVASGGKWQVRTTLSPSRSEPGYGPMAPIALPAQISSFETTGSAMILKGSIHNPFETPVCLVSITLSATTLDGTIVGAVTKTWEGELLPEKQEEFVLVLRYPASYSASELELDAQALGFRQIPKLP